MDLPWMLALVAGAAVLVTTTVARRTSGPLAGVLAAAPITPTISLVLLGAGGGDVLLRGLPVVVMVVGGVLLVILHRDTDLRAAVPGLLVVITLAALLFGPILLLSTGAVLAVTATLAGRRMRGPRHGRRARLPAWARFSIGSGAILAVGAAQGLWPAAAGWMALAPWMFVASATAAGMDGGVESAVRVLHGGVGGAMGVAAFVLVVAGAGASVPSALVLGWGAFALVAVGWHPLWTWAGLRRLPRRFRRRPVTRGTVA